jgi:hypothetical protein
MDIEDLDRRTREQIRDIQEDHQRRMAPLIKILSDLHMMRPIAFTLPEAEYMGAFGACTIDKPEYQRAQDELNSVYREMLDGIPISKARV